jgi:hypothetical protein
VSKPKPRKVIKPKTRKVRAGEGLRMPIPQGIAINSLDRFFSDSKIIEVIDCAFVRRRIRVKDLIDTNKKPAKKLGKNSSDTKG